MDIPKAVGRLAETAPTHLVNLLIVAMVFSYLHSRDEREAASIAATSTVTSERFEQCHELQARTIETLDELATAEARQATEFTILISTIERLIQEMRSFRQAYMEKPVEQALGGVRVAKG